VKFKSALVTQVSGSIGGFTAAHNSGGMYLRGRAVPTNPNTAAQQAARTALAACVAAWNTTLNDDQRAAWAVYSSNVPLVDALGDAREVSGLAMFVRCNQPRIVAGLDLVDDGPTVMQEGELSPVSIDDITIGGLGTAAVDVAFDGDDAWAAETGGALLIQVGVPQSPGVNFFAGPFRFADSVDGVDEMAPTSPQTVDSPFPIGDGNRVFIRARATRADGRLSPVQIVSAIASA